MFILIILIILISLFILLIYLYSHNKNNFTPRPFIGSKDSENNFTPRPFIGSKDSVNWWFCFKFPFIPDKNNYNFCDKKLPQSCLTGSFHGPDNLPQVFIKENFQCKWDINPYESSYSPNSLIKEKVNFLKKNNTYYKNQWSLQYLIATDKEPKLKKGVGCLGMTNEDPLGSTFNQIYNNNCNYLIYNDQFYSDPISGPDIVAFGTGYAHAKGMLAWDNNGDGIWLQVTTPNWPKCGSKKFATSWDGNTLGCGLDNNIEASQHFFCICINKIDVINILNGYIQTFIITDNSKPQLVYLLKNCPREIKKLVDQLQIPEFIKTWDSSCPKNYPKGSRKPPQINKKYLNMNLQGVGNIFKDIKVVFKPSKLRVPPWQYMSTMLNSVDIYSATWWQPPAIPSTPRNIKPDCPDWQSFFGDKLPGEVSIVKTGKWENIKFSLTASEISNKNHAKFGVGKIDDICIFSDINQQGAVRCGSGIYTCKNTAPPESPTCCATGQNYRGGAWIILPNKILANSLRELFIEFVPFNNCCIYCDNTICRTCSKYIQQCTFCSSNPSSQNNNKILNCNDITKSNCSS